MKISIIIPTYNCEKHICKSIDSIFLNVNQQVEIIVVDDGSTDNTRQILNNKYRDKIKYIYQKNQGPGAARNHGLKVSKGKYIVFLDSDDILLPGSLSLRSSFLDQHSEVGFVFSDYCFITDNLKDRKIGILYKKCFLNYFKDVILSIDKDGVVFKKTFLLKYFKFSPMPIWTGTVMIRRKLVDEIGFFREDVLIAEDVDYWFRALCNTLAGFVDLPLAEYRLGNNSITRKTEIYYRDAYKVFTGLAKIVLTDPLNSELKDRAKRVRIKLIKYYLKKCQYGKAIKVIYQRLR